MAKLSANGQELARLQRPSASGEGITIYSFRSNGRILAKSSWGSGPTRHSTGWKRYAKMKPEAMNQVRLTGTCKTIDSWLKLGFVRLPVEN